MQSTANDTKVKAVLFDLGETLLNFGEVDSAHLFYQGAKLSYEFLKQCGQPVGSFKLYCWRNLFAIRVRVWLSNITGRDFEALSLLKKLNDKKGVDLTEDQWRHLVWLWYEPLSEVCQIEPDINQTLTALKGLGLKLGIVSNTFVNGSSIEKHLQQIGILDFFTTRLYSYQFDYRKPSAKIFKTAAEKIGEEPENIIFIGDRINKDIAPAIKAGMHTVLKTAYTNTGKKTPNGSYKINHLSELPKIIEKINTETSQ